MGRKVYICAAGMIKFGKYTDVPVAALGSRAVLDLLRRSGLDRQSIQAAFVGSTYGGSLIGQRALRGVGISGIPVFNVENACASSGAALHLATLSVSAGQYETALVVGVEKLTALGGGTLPLPADEPDVRQGLTMPALYAMRAQLYMQETQCTMEDLCQVVIKSRTNGRLSPYAHMIRETTAAEIQAARMVAEPLTLYHCCPTSDGAAAVLVSATPVTGREHCVEVAASVVQGGKFRNGAKVIHFPETAALAAEQAYAMAGLGPADIRVAEVHDAFSIAEPLYYEAFGWAPRGEGWRLIREGAVNLGGRLPVNPGGGLLSRGHPVGASGVAQVVECYEQLVSRAGGRQVEGANAAFCQVSGGGASYLDVGASAVHILTR